MERTLLNFTPEMRNQLTQRKEEVMAFMALNMLSHTKKPVEIMKKKLYQNLQSSSTWEEIKENEISFAKQVLDTVPENYEESNILIHELTPLKGVELEHYLRAYGYFLFPELNVAFSLSKEVVEEYGIRHIA